VEVPAAASRGDDWGTDFVDFDGDGWRDVFVVNGHVEPSAERLDDPVGYGQPSLFFRSRGAAPWMRCAPRDVRRGLAAGAYHVLEEPR
jgi:hypothetical protein